MEHSGTIVSQEFVKTFYWNKMRFHEYLIRFNEFEGKHIISRRDIFKQKLIGAHILFDYNSNLNSVVKYKVLNYKPLEQIKNEQ